MRQDAIAAVKSEIRTLIKNHLLYEPSEGEVLPHMPQARIEGIDGSALEGTLLMWEIRVVVSLLGAPRQCDDLVAGIYEALKQHRLSCAELRVVMMSLHVDVRTITSVRVAQRASIHYVIEEVVAREAESARLPAAVN